MKIIIIVGSLRKESYNRKVAHFIKERYKDKLEMEILLLNDLPVFNEDIEENPPNPVKEFKEKIKQSEGVLFSTPEYNHSIPGGLKNALDWCSRGDRVLSKKPTFIVGSSSGDIGTARCQSDLRKVLDCPGVAALNLPGNHVLIGNIQDKFDQNGKFNDDTTIKRLDKVLDNYIDWVKKIK
ncbi:NADPH-dependent FMN reductase [Tissierella creatinophila]|uniref:NADPH azoreductase n=1 Tax=Tissierella creatinophila DSM 6911 TaxID=1123403 RepID=A0A1U7M8T3_TISCR|nr:NADPH-dependent FMN reductase [Tissierella creatinophila]OLS03608.1 NADPH azoreductase [Tissierella creatinophila DSM 6911]